MTTERDFWARSLAGIDFSGLEPPAGPWKIKENPLNAPDNPGKRFSLSRGLVSFELGMDQELSTLRWNGRLPSYLAPGNGLDEYMEFIYWMLIRLPTKLYPEKRIAWHYRQAYQEHTSVGLYFTNGKEDYYKFSNEKADKKLAIDFVTRGDEIQSILVTGTESPLLSDFMYMLKIDRVDFSDGAEMALAIPMRPENLRAWNPNTLEWILGIHAQKDKLGDLRQAAADLSSVVYSKAEEALQQKGTPK